MLKPLVASLLLLAGASARVATADTVLYRVNCGGPAVAALDAGPAWSVDDGGTPSPYVNAGTAGNNVFGSSAPMQAPHASVPAYVPAAVFDDERWDPGYAPEMTWEFPVAAGLYRVNLMLAEGYSGTQSPGARRIDFACEGAVVLADYDIYAHFGGYTPGMETFLVSVSDGSLSLELRHTTADDPAIRGIEIVAVPQAGTLSPAPGVVGFGVVQVGHVSAPHPVVITNLGAPGDPAISVSGASVTGPFAHTLTPQVLAPGQSRTFNVTFAPLAAGPATGTLTIQHDGNAAPLEIPLSGEGASASSIGFGKSILGGVSVVAPTTLQFGPDGRLYVGLQNGTIRVLTVQRTAPNAYTVTADEAITSIREILNHDDFGNPNPTVDQRLVTGLLVTGTAANPVLYVTSSDPRMAVAGDINLDTNSGVLSRLAWNGAAWVHTPLVRGLPRCENDHATNGMALDPVTNTLFIGQGGNTNMGAPSNNFSFLSEYALSAAILSVDLDAIGNTTYDLPTLDDEDRPGEADFNDPFGGNDGKNQARLVPGGPVQVYSPGWRNPYDVLVHSSGRVYAIDNGPNAGWGGPPVGEGPGAGCTNGDNDNDSASLADNLHLVPPGFYAGHPNPTRARTANTFNATNPQSPVAADHAIECDYLPPGVPVALGGDGALATWNFSTNGLTEYRGSNFGGQMQGDLLAATFNNTIERVRLNAAGDSAALVQSLFTNVGVVPLDVTAQGDADSFPGTVWVADFYGGAIVVFEPADYDGGAVYCDGANVVGQDDDGDGYDNADEIANGTSPCSAADVPPDFDHDYVSDRADTDDDADGVLDVADAFARDAANGATVLPVRYSWDGGDPGFGFFGLGFTGLMLDGATDYLDQFEPVRITAGGAAGKFTIDQVPAGDALGALNTQAYAFQFGVATDGSTGPFRVRSRVSSPYFSGAAPAGAQSLGIFMGDGGDDDYLKLVLAGDAGAPVLDVVHEVAGVPATTRVPVPGYLGYIAVDLALDVDPLAGTVQPLAGPYGASLAPVGPPIALTPGSALHGAVTGPAPLAVGVLATSRDATPFVATWDYFDVLPMALVDVAPAAAPAALRLLPPSPNPVRAGTALRFALPGAAHVRLALYDVTGARARTLVDEARAAGVHEIRYDGRGDDGRPLAAGVYFARLDAGRTSCTQRVVVVR